MTFVEVVVSIGFRCWGVQTFKHCSNSQRAEESRVDRKSKVATLSRLATRLKSIQTPTDFCGLLAQLNATPSQLMNSRRATHNSHATYCHGPPSRNSIRAMCLRSHTMHWTLGAADRTHKARGARPAPSPLFLVVSTHKITCSPISDCRIK